MTTPVSALDRRQCMLRLLALAVGTQFGAARAATGDSERDVIAPARMRSGMPSATAQSAATYRAVHQVLDHPHVLDDPLALPILGRESLASLQSIVDRQSRSMRASIAMRSRHAEDRLAIAVGRGVRQYVVLGAGLDTFAYRNVYTNAGLRVFEVDHPATQQWKRQRLREAGIGVPSALTFVAVDFETQRLDEQLRAAGLRTDQPVFFSMLGVAIYISRDALFGTMQVVRDCAAESEIVFDFALPTAMLPERQQASRLRSIAAMRALGESWISFYEPGLLADALRNLSFQVDVLSAAAANREYFSGRADGLRISGSTHMLAARV